MGSVPSGLSLPGCELVDLAWEVPAYAPLNQEFTTRYGLKVSTIGIILSLKTLRRRGASGLLDDWNRTTRHVQVMGASLLGSA